MSRPLKRYSLADQPLYFLHIPKTAGTTLISILDSYFDWETICPAQAWPDSAPIPISQLAGYRFVRGHLDYDAISRLPGKPLWITLLRDPVERVISLYSYWNYHSEPWIYHDPDSVEVFQRAISSGLKTFVGYPDLRVAAQVANGQTRLLASGVRNNLLQDPVSDRELLEKATQHLEECAFFGLTERFQESLSLLCYTLGLKPATSYSNLMTTPNRPRRDEIEPDIIAAILERNQLDMELYRNTCKRFEERFAAMVNELLEREFEEQYRRQYPPVAKPSSRLNFDEALYGSGWHGRERWHDTPFRWTGPATTSILELPLPIQSHATIRFRILGASAPDVLDSLTLAVNGMPVTLTRSQDHEGGIIFEGNVSPSALNSDRPFSRLIFTVNRTIAPQMLDPLSQDKRLLGLAFHWLKVDYES